MRPRTAIVTGAGGAIGRAVSRRLQSDGVLVGLLDRDREAINRAAAELAENGNAVATAVADVSDGPSAAAAIEHLSVALGGLDVLVAAAGVMSRTPLNDLEAKEFEAILTENVIGTFLAVKAALPYLKRGHNPAVITISSAAGLSPRSITGPAYRVAKAGVIALTRVLASELLEDGIRVNCVAPGAVEGGMSKAFTKAELSTMAGQAIGRRLANPNEIAAAVAFLQSNDATYLTGEVIRIAGNARA